MTVYLSTVRGLLDPDDHSTLVVTPDDATVVSLEEAYERKSKSLQAIVDIRVGAKNEVDGFDGEDKARELMRLIFTNIPYVASGTITFETEEEAMEMAYRMREIE